VAILAIHRAGRQPARRTTGDPFTGGYASLDKGGSFTWWAKYPAPPSEVKKVNCVTPLGAPFDDVPVSDR